MLANRQKQGCRTVGFTLYVYLEQLVDSQNVASLFSSTLEDNHLNWLLLSYENSSFYF